MAQTGEGVPKEKANGARVRLGVIQEQESIPLGFLMFLDLHQPTPRDFTR